MAVTKLDSNDIAVMISTDLVTPAYKEAVCGTDITLDGSVDINVVNTKCAKLKSISEPDYTISFGGVANTTPTTLSELSAQELALIFDAGDPVLVKLVHRTDPTKYYRQGQAYITSYTEDAPLDGVLSFDIEMGVDGVLDFAS